MTIPKRDICSRVLADQGFTEKVGEKLQQLVGNGPIRIVQSNYKDVRSDRS